MNKSEFIISYVCFCSALKIEINCSLIHIVLQIYKNITFNTRKQQNAGNDVLFWEIKKYSWYSQESTYLNIYR